MEVYKKWFRQFYKIDLDKVIWKTIQFGTDDTQTIYKKWNKELVVLCIVHSKKQEQKRNMLT